MSTCNIMTGPQHVYTLFGLQVEDQFYSEPTSRLYVGFLWKTFRFDLS
jgi:hypothetical protein